MPASMMSMWNRLMAINSFTIRLPSLLHARVCSTQRRSLSFEKKFKRLPAITQRLSCHRCRMYCREDLRKLKRITLLWDYIREVTELNGPLLLGETREMRFAD